MRVALVYDCFFPNRTGGGERLYRQISERLVDLGHDVEYLTAQQWDDAPKASFRVTPILRAVELYNSQGVRRSGVAVAFSLSIAKALARRRSKYDLVIVSGLPVLNVFAARAALAGALGGRTLVVDYLEVWGRRQWLEYAGVLTGTIAWMLQRLALALTPVATCHSRLTERQLRAEGFRGTVLRSPGLIEGESGAIFTPEAASPPYVLFAGRHIPDKQIETLPLAVKEARKVIPDLKLVILGEGPSRAGVLQAVEEVEGGEWVTAPGFVSEDELKNLMAGAAVLANPSRREGYGLVVVEAAAHGTPSVVIGVDTNASAELVDSGVNGYIAASTSAQHMGTALVDAIQGGPHLRRTTRSWYEDAIKTKTIARTVDAIVESALRPPPRTTDSSHTRENRS